MKWAEGLSTNLDFLYLAISVFAAVNIYSVDSGVGEKRIDFLLCISICRSYYIYDEKQVFENFAVVFFILGVVSLLGLHVLGSEIKGQKNWYKIGGFPITTCRVC